MLACSETNCCCCGVVEFFFSTGTSGQAVGPWAPSVFCFLFSNPRSHVPDAQAVHSPRDQKHSAQRQRSEGVGSNVEGAPASLTEGISAPQLDRALKGQIKHLEGHCDYDILTAAEEKKHIEWCKASARNAISYNTGYHVPGWSDHCFCKFFSQLILV